MAKLTNLTNIWNNVKEIDLRPIRQEALQVVKIAVVGASGSGRATLISQMLDDPSRPGMEANTPLPVFDLDTAQQAADADLIILLLNAEEKEFGLQKTLARDWANAKKNVLVFINQNQSASDGSSASHGPWVDWGQSRALYGSVQDTSFLLAEFVPVVMELLSEQLLSLARYFPLFRIPVARHLINETCFSNATYSLSTGIAEIVPVFDIPLNVADMIVLSKTQAFLVYRLGLALGLSTNWQDYVTEFGSVLGGGFLWRQLARSLVGLIPVWGIIPKVAVAYAGTYVVGNVVLRWYLTGRHVTGKQMRELYVQAFARGKNLARGLLSKVPRPKVRKRKPAALPAPRGKQRCPNCGRLSAADASFCQYCGHPLGRAELTSGVETSNE